MKNLLNTIDEVMWPMAIAAFIIFASVHFIPLFIGVLIFK